MADPRSRFRDGFDRLLADTPDPPDFEEIGAYPVEVGVASSPGRRWLVAAASLGFVLVVVALNMFWLGGDTSPVSQPSITSGTDPMPAVSTSLPARVTEPLFGQELPWTLVFDDGLSGIAVVDLSDPQERRVKLGGQRPGDQPYRSHLVSGHLITGWGEIFAESLEDLTVTSLGEATVFVPAAENDRVWLIDYPGGRIGQGDPLVWQVFPDGSRASETYVVERGGLPAIGIPGGLALEADNGVALWNAESGEVTSVLGSEFGFVADESDGMLAWCERNCEVLHVTDTATGANFEILLPDGRPPEDVTVFDARSARFSHDGRYLASIAGTDVLVTDLDTGDTRVAITDVQPFSYLGWAPSDPDLFVASYGYGEREVDVAYLHVPVPSVRKATLPYGGTLGFQVVATTQATRLLSDRSVLECPITLPEGDPFVPPDTHPATPGDDSFWYGTDDLWTVLLADGTYRPRKSVWWSANFPGGGEEGQPDIQVEWRHHGVGTPVKSTAGLGTNAWTAEQGSFMIADRLDVQTPGCWEVTGTYKGATLTYVYYVPNNG